MEKTGQPEAFLRISYILHCHIFYPTFYRHCMGWRIYISPGNLTESMELRRFRMEVR